MSEQSSLYNIHNTDDVLVRSVISGLLGLLNNAIVYKQVWDNDTMQDVTVPWYYGFSHANNERFLQDNYTFFGRECFGSRRMDTDFNSYPKGVIVYKGCQIDAGSCTSPVMGTFMRNDRGVLTTYKAMMESIPLNMTFDCTVITADTDFLSVMKIEQAIRYKFYKNQSFYVMFSGVRVGCTVGFPEQYSYEPTMDLTYDNVKRENKMTFTLGVETYQPVFDPTTAIPADCVMESIGLNVMPAESADVSAVITDPAGGAVMSYSAGAAMEIRWDFKADTTETYSLCLDFVPDSGGPVKIAYGLYCYSGEYIWNIPDGMTGFTQPEIYVNSDKYRFGVMPSVRVIPNGNGEITAGSFIITDPGSGAWLDEDKDGTVPFSLEYVDDDGNVVIDDNYMFRVTSQGAIDLTAKEGPVKLKTDTCSVYKRDIAPVTGKIVLTITGMDVKAESGPIRIL